MAIVSDVEIRLRADIARLQQDMNRVRGSVDATMNQVTRAATVARNALAGITAGIGLSELASLTDQYTKFTAQLKLATNSQKEYARAVEDVKRISTSAQNDIGATGVLYARIIASTRELGVSQSQVAKVTETVNLALAATGAGASESASAMLQLSQAFGSGVLRGEEFNAVYEAAPELLRILARDMDIPIGKLRKLAEAGALTSDKLVKAFSNNAVIEGLRENVAQITTISGALTVFKNNLIEIIGTQAHASGAVKIITTAILGAADAVKVLTGALGPALKIALAYFAAFVAAPAIFQFAATAMGNLRVQIALAKLEMANGATIASLFSGSIGGVGIAAQWASGMLGKLAIASSVAFAAFAGWEIGKYLESQFVEVEIAAEVMAGELMKAWQVLKFAFKDAFDAITLTAREGIAFLTRGMSGWFGLVADGMRLIGKSEAAEGVDKFAASIVKATEVEGTYAARSAERRAEMEKQIKLIDLDTDRRATNAYMRDRVAGAADRETAGVVKGATEATKATKAQIAAYASLIASLELRVAETAREAAGLAALTTAEKAHIDLTNDIKNKKLLLTKAEEARARSLINEAGANDVITKANKEYADLQQQLADNARDLATERYTLIESAKDEAQQNEFLVETFGMAEEAIIRLRASRLLDQEAQRLGRELTADEIADLERVIELKERSAKAVANRRQLEETKQYWTDVEKTARDTFVSITDGGKNAFQRLKDTAKNVFFDWLYQQTLKKWIINIQANAAGGVSSVAQALGGSGGAGGVTSLINMGKTIYSGFTGGLATTLGGWASTAGGLFGSSAVSSFGAGLSAAGNSGMAAIYASAQTSGNLAAGASAGLSAGTYAIPIAGWIAAGMTVANRLYKSGWDATNGTLNTAGKVFGSSILAFNSVLKKIGLSSSAANILSGQSTISKLFGRKNPEIESQGIQGTIGASGFSGQAFANVLEKGGIFRSDKRTTVASALNAEQDSAFDATITSMVTAVRGFAQALGLSTSTIDGYQKQIKLTLGKDEAENQKLIAEMFAGVGEELATGLLPTIGQFQVDGETAAIALERVANNFAAVTQIMTAVGTTADKAFGAVGVASLEARERLIALAGGLDALAAQTTYFNENFLSQAEQIAIIQKPLTAQLEALGYAGITTAEQFKDAVQELAASGRLATQEGAATYAGLLALGPAFKTVADYLKEVSDAAAEASKAEADKVAAEVEKAAALASALAADRRQLEIRLMEASGDAAGALAARRALETAAADESLRPLLALIYAREDETAAAEALAAAADLAAAALEKNEAALRKGVDDAFAAVGRAVNAEKELVTAAYQETMKGIAAGIAAVNVRVADLTSLSKALKSGISSVESDAQQVGSRSAARAQVQAAIAIAKASGVLPSLEDLQGALSTLRIDAGDQFSTLADYQREVARTNNELATLGGLTDKQLTDAQRQLAVLEDQKALTEQQHVDEMARLDGILEWAQAEVNAINGVNTSVLGLWAAMNNLNIALGDLRSGATTSNPTGSTLSVEQLYRDVLGREGEAAGVAFWRNAFGSVVDSGEYAEFLKSAQPELDMRARQQREAVATVPMSGTMSSSSASNQQDMTQMSARLDRIAAATEQFASQFNQVTAGGNALLTETA